jgi:hypothetical protein
MRLCKSVTQLDVTETPLEQFLFGKNLKITEKKTASSSKVQLTFKT